MFSFHKPKIYRSNLGCCICKAKSSSSRFTDSKKYENEFEQCFRLKEKRSGEICNACVLLVKRWKKLSHENRLIKHWHHVVDARAGPGTKLTGNKRLTSPASRQQRSSNFSGSSSFPSSSNSTASDKQHRVQGRCSEVLPLSSSQANNQSNNQSGSSIKARSLSKVCAIDTNVSTFTFGEPIANVNRTRSYMSSDTKCYSPSSMSSSSTYSSSLSLTASLKPQSALNSSAFESVIKRFRQRQQQQHLEAQRRLLSRQQRAQQRNGHTQNDHQQTTATDKRADSTNANTGTIDSNNTEHQQQPQSLAAKRTQRYSSNENTFGISSVLDSSIWRREKICCGVIFRGLYNEIAIVPRLIKPCQCRINSTDGSQPILKSKVDEEDLSGENDEALINEQDSDERLPPPRVSKSGSISSCDSNTSGCGSMEEATSGSTSVCTGSRRSRGKMEPIEVQCAARKRQRLNDKSKQQHIIGSPGGSSSGNSSSRLVTGDDEEGEHDESLMMDGDLILEMGDATSTSDSSNDATSSSIESLASTELGGKETNAIAFG